MNAPPDYSAVLADLESKRDQLNAAIAVIRALGSGGGIEALPSGVSVTSFATEGAPSQQGPQPAVISSQAIDENAFFKMSTPAAVKKYLGMVKRPQTPRAIADALRAGGQVHAGDPKTAYLNVYSALKRGKEFVQTRNKEWVLADWYVGKTNGSGE